jgi:hypothetical protein
MGKKGCNHAGNEFVMGHKASRSADKRPRVPMRMPIGSVGGQKRGQIRAGMMGRERGLFAPRRKAMRHPAWIAA